MNNVVKFLALSSVFFYVLCWFTHQPTKLEHNVGLVLPWASLLFSVLIGLIWDIKNKEYFAAWGYTYAAVTVIYVVVVSIMAGSIWHQLPHLCACTCFISYFTLEHSKRE